MVTASGGGLDVGSMYPLVLVLAGVAVFVAIGALSHQAERAFSAALIYLGLGLLAASVIGGTGADWLDPFADTELLERVAELALVFALFGSGLKLDRALAPREWISVGRLLAVAMPLTIVACAAMAGLGLGLSLAAAVVLGAALAPTDPVLAGDIGVGPPGEEDEREPKFAITAEAGMNDGFAFPFVLLGLGLATDGGGWVVDWLVWDVLYGVAVAIALGVAVGWSLAAGIVRLRDRRLLSPELDRFVAIAAPLVVFGLADLADAYGFLAAFAGGVAFRRYERDHELNWGVHEGAESLDKLAELTVIVLVMSMVTLDGLALPGWSGWALAILLLLVIRPLAVAVSFIGSPLAARERIFLSWFGVRGVGSLYYALFAVASGAFAAGEAGLIYWTVIACVLISITVHGVTGSPLARRWLGSRGSRRGKRRAPVAAHPALTVEQL